MLTNREVQQYIMRLTDQWFGMTYVQIAVAVLVAILGIVNTLTVSITDRRRDSASCRPSAACAARFGGRSGWRRWRSRIGLILGLAFGAVNLHYMLEITRRDIARHALDYMYPVVDRPGIFRRCSRRRSCRPSGRPSRPCGDRWWRRWNMSELLIAVLAAAAPAPRFRAHDARQIMRRRRTAPRPSRSATRALLQV